jgi:hypothetical protein
MKKRTYILENKPKGLPVTTEMVKLFVPEEKTVSDNFYTKSETDEKDTAVITTLRDGVAEAGNTLQKLYNLLSGAGAEITVANIAARNALNISSIGTRVFVTDDGDGKWALYRASQTGVSSNYVKLSDPDLLNAVMSAEMIKTAYESNPDTNAFTNALKAAYDAVVSGFSGKANTSDISQNVEADKASTTKWYSAKSIYDWVTEKLALKANISSLPLTIANGSVSSTLLVSGVVTLLREENIGSFSGKDILKFDIRARRTITANNSRIIVRLFDTVTLVETEIAVSESANPSHTNWLAIRSINLNESGGNIYYLNPTLRPITDESSNASSYLTTSVSFSNPQTLRIYGINITSPSDMVIYSSLIQVL